MDAPAVIGDSHVNPLILRRGLHVYLSESSKIRANGFLRVCNERRQDVSYLCRIDGDRREIWGEVQDKRRVFADRRGFGTFLRMSFKSTMGTVRYWLSAMPSLVIGSFPFLGFLNRA
jgi:hypothetical protein